LRLVHSARKTTSLDAANAASRRHNLLHPGQQFFFALFSSFRFLINLPLLDRPLTMAFFWGLITGDWTQSLGVGIFFELLWLDIFPAGTIIPPNSLAPTLSSLCVMHLLGVTSPAMAVVILFASLPFGRLFARLERYHRQYENDAFNKLMLWTKHPERLSGPVALTRSSLAVMLPLSGVAFALAVSALLALMHVLLPRVSPYLGDLPLTWTHLWVVGSIGALLSLRHRPAYVVLLGGVVLAVASRLVS